MKYIPISFLVLLCVEILGAEKSLEEVTFTEDTSGSVTLNVIDSTACLLFLKYASSEHVIHYVTAPIGNDIGLLKALEQRQKEIDADAKVVYKTCFITSSLLRYSSEEFSRCLSKVSYCGSFPNVDKLESTVTVTYDGQGFKIRSVSRNGCLQMTI